MSDIPSRALRETLRDHLATPLSSTSGCVDVDMLAAWGDGTLSRRDRATVESHAATCARCQAMLAAMAKTALPARKWWQASTVRWLVPIAVCSALAIVIWTNVPVGRQAARVRLSERGGERDRLSASAPVSETRSAEVATAAPKAIDKLERPSESKPAERRAAETDKPSALAEVVAVPSAPVLTVPTAPSSTVQPASAIAPDVAARDALVPPPAQAQAELRSAAARGRAGVAASARAEGFRTSVAPLEIPSPNRNIRWRIVAGTSVERSTDSGITWQAQSIGAAVRLMTAGAAPSPTTCWLVGAGGVVLVSQDGQTWERVAFPEAIDLTAILATDGSNATVTAADGRVFSTTDGGKTWRSP
jgi:hypothetical protein